MSLSGCVCVCLLTPLVGNNFSGQTVPCHAVAPVCCGFDTYFSIAGNSAAIWGSFFLVCLHILLFDSSDGYSNMSEFITHSTRERIQNRTWITKKTKYFKIKHTNNRLYTDYINTFVHKQVCPAKYSYNPLLEKKTKEKIIFRTHWFCLHKNPFARRAATASLSANQPTTTTTAADAGGIIIFWRPFFCLWYRLQATHALAAFVVA